MHLKGVRFGFPLIKRVGLLKHRETYGEYAGKEIWDTEGNLGGASSFYSYAFSPRGAANEAAFGVRGWSEMFFSGIARLFIYSMHNTDAWRNGGYMSTIDYDRSVNVWAAATATTNCAVWEIAMSSFVVRKSFHAPRAWGFPESSAQMRMSALLQRA